jgi:acetoin utilization deacetylase AcuC-like enzyme
LAKLNRPTVFVMEGGYALDDIGLNVTNTLIGFEQGS